MLQPVAPSGLGGPAAFCFRAYRPRYRQQVKDGETMNDDNPGGFEALKGRARRLGWELAGKSDKRPFYLLQEIGKDKANACTNSAVSLYSENPDNPLSGLDSVSHMLDQIEKIQGRLL
jgi:hypothetical protein